MTQLSLHIDEETLKKIELAANSENLSISQFVTEKLKQILKKSWPDNYETLFGSISDETFGPIKELNYENNILREKL